MDKLEPYRLRFWKRFVRDATPWARDNIVWGVVVLVVPPLAAYFRDPHAQIDWPLIKNALWLYGFAFLIYALVHLCRTPKKLDADRDTREILLVSSIAINEEDIRKRDETIRVLTDKPKRTAVEQRHYETAEKALQKLGGRAAIALRHLRQHKSLQYGMYDPILPAGMTGSEFVNLCSACVEEGLVSQRNGYPTLGERTFEIAPTMEKALDELLYKPDDTT